jgi:hypothetical protein
MAKLKTEAIIKSDLLDYLDRYSDFSFELSVLKMLREHDISCEHGGHYVDPVTHKSREFDIRATKTINIYRVRMSVECKNIRENFPILVSCVPRHEDESYHQVALVSERKRSLDSMSFAASQLFESRAKVSEIKGVQSLYPSGEPVGKTVVQVGRTMDGSITANDSELYDKWGQCLSSLHGMAQSMYWDGDEHDLLGSYFSAALPFVVVPNERLWIASYDLDGQCISEPMQVDRCPCFIGKAYRMATDVSGAVLWVSHLEIVTINGLRSFVERYLMTTEDIKRLYSVD